ncbi:MAG: ubiquitin-like domain-containing protein [Bacillota bacterium]|nr:ubiquitin-like domain-containing protein [Bacillota bacterium]
MRKPVSIIIDGKKTEYITYSSTVAKLLKSKDIALGPKDKIEPSLSSKVTKGETIKIKRAQNINIFADGNEIKELTPLDTVDELLKFEGITLREKDKISPALGTKLTEGMNVNIIRVDNKLFKETKPIDFATIIKTNSSLPNTTRKIVQKGKAGVKTLTTNVIYEDGKEISRNLVSEVISAKPVDSIIVQGTYPLMPVSRGGDILPFSKVVNVRATAYWAVYGVGTTRTGSGRLAVRDPGGYSTIAVDRRMFPYGTKLFVEGYGFAIAADTGTAIVGNRIDVYFNTRSEACRYGSKYVKVYVLK